MKHVEKLKPIYGYRHRYIPRSYYYISVMSPFQRRELEEGEIYEPDVWELHTDYIGKRPFYYSGKHRFSTYNHPSIYSGNDVVILDHGPESWVKHFAYYLDDEGEEIVDDRNTFVYYHCPESDEISYEMPIGYVEVIREYEEERSGNIVTSLLYPRLPAVVE